MEDIIELVENVIANKEDRRKNKIDAINISASIRDGLEFLINKLLQKKLGISYEDIKSNIESDFDKIEDKLYKILNDHLEYKTNNEELVNKEEEIDIDNVDNEEGNEEDNEDEDEDEEDEYEEIEIEEITEPEVTEV